MHVFPLIAYFPSWLHSNRGHTVIWRDCAQRAATYRRMNENGGRRRVATEIWRRPAPNVHKALSLSAAQPSSHDSSTEPKTALRYAPVRVHFLSFSRDPAGGSTSCMIRAASASRHGGGGGDGADEDDDVPRSSVEELEMGLLANDEHASSSSSSPPSPSRESLVDVDGDGLEGEDGGVRPRARAVLHDGYGYGEGEGEGAMMMKAAPLTREDKKAMALLIVLCAFFVVSLYGGSLHPRL